MGKIKTSLGIFYGVIVILVAIVLGAYLLYGEQLGQTYNKYFGGEEQFEQQEPEVAPEDERPPRDQEPADEEPDEEEPADDEEPTVEEPAEEPTGEIEIESRYPGKIVYTTDTGQDPASYMSDCEKRGGTFNECGDTCGPDADFCVQVCAYTCENISTDNEQSAADEEPAEESAEGPLGAPEPGTEIYSSENFGIALSFPSDMQVEKQDGRLRIYKWGPTQREGTELYDGIIITFVKPENPDNLDLQAFAEQQLESELQFEGEVIEPVTRVRHGEFTGYEFTVSGLGVSTSFFFENGEKEIVRLIYFVEDPGNLGFEGTLTEILDSLESL